ncbi:MAG TPA: hypothetical protein VNH64_04565 [Parvularculaceae bacterium]|nr:hypothetical protein [Parvularculaceae bacterium]
MTARQPSSERDLRLQRAKACLDAYGANRARWPEDARALFDKFSGDYRFEILQREAALLDETLGEATPIEAGEVLKERLLAAFNPAPASARVGSFLRFGVGAPRAARLIPAGALAGLSALGFAIGAATANDAGVENDPAFDTPATFAYPSDTASALWEIDQ